MHELSITKDIFSIIREHAIENNVEKVVSINLEIGVLSDVQNEWIQHYFDYLSKDSVVSGAKLIIKRTPAEFKCNVCNASFQINSSVDKVLKCESCNSEQIVLLSGNEFTIKNMEVQ